MTDCTVPSPLVTFIDLALIPPFEFNGLALALGGCLGCPLELPAASLAKKALTLGILSGSPSLVL